TAYSPWQCFAFALRARCASRRRPADLRLASKGKPPALRLREPGPVAGRVGSVKGAVPCPNSAVPHIRLFRSLVLRIQYRSSLMRAFRAKYIVPLAAVVALSASTFGWIAVANGQEPQSGGERRRTCTLASLQGNYGNQVSGVARQPNGTTALRFEANGVEIFDGAGHTR